MLTPQEFEKLKKTLQTKPIDTSISQPSEGNYLQRVGGSFMGAAKDIVSAVNRPSEMIAGGATVPETAVAVGEAGLRTAGEVAGAALSPITELPGVKQTISGIGSLIARIPGASNVAEKIQSWSKAHPEAAKDLEAAINIATLVAGKPAIEKSAVVGAKTAGGVVGKAGEVAKGAGEKLYRVVAPMEQSTARAVQAYQATQPTLFGRIRGLFSPLPKEVSTPIIRESETAARVGLSGTEWQIGVQAKRAATKLWDDTINPALSGYKGKVNMKEFFSDLKKRIIAETPELSRRKSLIEALDDLTTDFKHVSDISVSKLQAYKEGWAKFVPQGAYKGKPISGLANEVRNMASQEARARIYELLGEKLKQAYLDYGNLQSIIDAGIKSVDALRSKSAFRQAWEFVLDKTLTPIASYGGKVLYRTGEGLEFIGKSGATKVKDLISQ